MTLGKLKKTWPDQTLEATVGPDGWQCPDPNWEAHLNSAFPVGGTTAGVAWVAAFRLAVKAMGAEVITEPEADSMPPGTIF